jgi:hypothetical protein
MGKGVYEFNEASKYFINRLLDSGFHQADK